MRNRFQVRLPILIFVCVVTVCASAQSFRVQCPSSTITHPDPTSNNSEPTYSGATVYTCSVPNGCGGTAGNVGYLVPNGAASGAIKCQQISGGDGYATMGDGTQTYMFSFGPLSGLADIASGLPGTQFPDIFNAQYGGSFQPGDPATSNGASDAGAYVQGTLGLFAYNGAVGQVPDIPYLFTIYDISEGPQITTGPNAGKYPVTVVLNSQSSFNAGDVVKIAGTGTPPAAGPYDGNVTVTAVNIVNPYLTPNFAFQYLTSTPGLPDVNQSATASAASIPAIDGHVDARQIMDVAVMNGNIPAPMMAIDEDDEFFLTLTNVGMIMRPDLFEQHTVHFHGYPNASSFYDGVPDASVAINIGGSFTYYYLAPDAGTYFWHCHITPPEHLQMGMVGQLYVRPRQNRVAVGNNLHDALALQQADPRTKCDSSNDILCSNPVPPANSATRAAVGTLCSGGTGPSTEQPKYVYNDGDGSTCYDVEFPLQIHGFDPNFHFVGMTFNPEGFTDMKDKYFLLNGRSYPDTVSTGPQATQSVDGAMHYSQPLNAIITIPVGGRALLRISDLDVTEYQTLASLGIPMTVVGYNAKLLRDQEGNNMSYKTNSITLGGGESLDVILDASDTSKYPSGSVFYLYTPNLDHLSNDAENFGGLMTEVRIN